MTQRTEQADAAKAALKAAVIELIAEHGLDAFSFTDIAARAGKSRSLAVHHFGTREALVEEAVRELLDYNPQAPNTAETLESFLATVRKSLSASDLPRQRALYVVLGTVSERASTLHLAGRWYGVVQSAIAAKLEAVSRSGGLRDGVDVQAQSYLVLTIIRGALFVWFSKAKGFDLSSLANEVEQTLRRALEPAAKLSAPEKAQGRTVSNNAPGRSSAEDDAELLDHTDEVTAANERLAAAARRAFAAKRLRAEESAKG